MTARTITALPRPAPKRIPLSWVVADALVITRRNLIKYARVPELLVFSTLQPVMFVLLFAYVFGGAIQTPGVNYIDFLIPGILIQDVVFGSTSTGVGLADDLSKGLIDRFRSLPMARSAVLAGRTLADSVRNVFVVLLMTGVGFLIGFRFHNGILPALGALGLAVLFGFAFSWISATIGLLIRDVETVNVAGFVWLFPLTFASSAFVPTQTMPDWLRVFADNNPITKAVNALRGLVLGDAFLNMADIWWTLAWIAGILIVFVPLAVSRYRRT